MTQICRLHARAYNARKCIWDFGIALERSLKQVSQSPTPHQAVSQFDKSKAGFSNSFFQDWCFWKNFQALGILAKIKLFILNIS